MTTFGRFVLSAQRFLRATMLWLILIPTITWLLGAVSNQAVLIANHDKFPVMVNAYKVARYADAVSDDPTSLIGLSGGYLDSVHCIMTSQTHLNWLADIFDLGGTIYSPGDVLLYLGEWSWTFFSYAWIALILKKLWQSSSAS